MRILLTGVAGFIGSHLAEGLLQDDHQVIGADNFITGQRSNLSVLSAFTRFRFLEQDVSKRFSVDGPVDWVMHFASPASPPKYLEFPLETLAVNSLGTQHLLDLAVQKKARFFLASTSEVYGDPAIHPQPETYWGNVNSLGPRSVYDEGKRYAETMSLTYHKLYELPIRIVRIFNTYGPRMDPADGRVVTNFITQALQDRPLTVYGDGRQTRSFQYVTDLIEAIMRLMKIDFSEPVNLGNPVECSVLELAELVIKLSKSKSEIISLPLPQDDPLQRCPDIARAQNLLDWEPRVDLTTGLTDSIEYYRRVVLDAAAC